jgi:hypothetical protein
MSEKKGSPAPLLRAIPKRTAPGKGKGGSVSVTVTFAADDETAEIVSAAMTNASGKGMRFWRGALPCDETSTLASLCTEAYGRASGSIVDEYPTAPDKLSGRDGVGIVATFDRNGKHLRSVMLSGAWGEGLTFAPHAIPATMDHKVTEVGDAAIACSRR